MRNNNIQQECGNKDSIALEDFLNIKLPLSNFFLFLTGTKEKNNKVSFWHKDNQQ